MLKRTIGRKLAIAATSVALIVSGASAAFAAADLTVTTPAGQDAGQVGNVASATIHAGAGFQGRAFRCEWMVQQPLGSGGWVNIQVPNPNANAMQVLTPAVPGSNVGQVWATIKQAGTLGPFYATNGTHVFAATTNPPTTVTSSWVQTRDVTVNQVNGMAAFAPPVSVPVRSHQGWFFVVWGNQVFTASTPDALWPSGWNQTSAFTVAQVNSMPQAQSINWQTVTNPAWNNSTATGLGFGNNSVFAFTTGDTNFQGVGTTQVTVPTLSGSALPQGWRVVPACALAMAGAGGNAVWGNYVTSSGPDWNQPFPTPTPTPVTPTPPAQNIPAWCRPHDAAGFTNAQRNPNNFGDRLDNRGSNRNRLREGEWLISQDCRWGLTVMASDGNVVLVRLNPASGDTNQVRSANITATRAATNQLKSEFFGRSPASLVLRRSDGMLIQYLGAENASNRVAWNGTPGAGSTRTLVLQNDGNLVLFGSGTRAAPTNPVWARWGLSSNNNTGEQAWVSGNRFARTRFFAVNNQ